MATVQLRAIAALVHRELKRFVRQPTRIVASVGTPMVMLVFLGSGFAGSFRGGVANGSYVAHLLPGLATLSVVFGAVFGSISLIEDRHAGFLQSVLVSPVAGWAVAAAKLAAGSVVATAEGVVLLAAAPLVGLEPTAWGLFAAVAVLALIALGVGGVSLSAAWWVDSVPGFHGVMNLVLMPMWLLSGALFPVSGASMWLRWVMLANPLTWSTAALRVAMGGPAETPGGSLPAVVVAVAFGIAGAGLAGCVVGRGGRGAR